MEFNCISKMILSLSFTEKRNEIILMNHDKSERYNLKTVIFYLFKNYSQSHPQSISPKKNLRKER
jgi:hypothetical protein